jgi:hypothetical protein
MSKMSAYDFVPAPAKVGGISAATGTDGGSAMFDRFEQFARDAREGRVRVSKIEVSSSVEPQTIVNTVLTITFTEVSEADAK